MLVAVNRDDKLKVLYNVENPFDLHVLLRSVPVWFLHEIYWLMLDMDDKLYQNRISDLIVFMPSVNLEDDA